MKRSEIIGIFKKTGSLLEGHFELRSGLHSDRYFQCANVLSYPLFAGRLCRELAAKVKASRAFGHIDCVISPALGGLVVGHELGRALRKRAVFAEKQDGILIMRRFQIVPGMRYLIAEDVVTRGGRVQETIDLVSNGGGQPAGVAFIVDRSGGKASFSCPVASLLKIEPVTYEPGECPLCRASVPISHPGS